MESPEIKKVPLGKKGKVADLTTKAGHIWEVMDSEAEMEK
jgi:hypothetical protein